MDTKASTNNLASPDAPNNLKPDKQSLIAPSKAGLSGASSRANIAAGLTHTPSTVNIAAIPAAEKPPLEKPPIGEALAPGNNNEIPLDGILSLFLSGMTQDIFKIKSNEDVTAEKPIKIIPKADIIADVMARRAVSDFQPYLEMIKVWFDFSTACFMLRTRKMHLHERYERNSSDRLHLINS
ncbi:UNVERIFIED_CONTAM: hypothetical protein HDU68_007177 [Siphonaria sp. JEL0065]|nr:hypothetical protein HDU68_007177 [Siphonaria sp. JEL0065]